MIPPNLALIAWIPVALALFAKLRPQVAVLACFILGVLFLPVFSIPIPGFINYSKDVAIALAATIGMLAMDKGRLEGFQFRKIDIPVFLLLLTDFTACLGNGISIYGSISSTTYMGLAFALPYFLGRIYFSDREGMNLFALGILLGTAVYVPLCVYEVRLSPQLNIYLYGYHQASFLQSIRGSLFRPVVFMNHGLMVGLWMCAGATVAVILHWGKHVQKIGGYPFYLWALLFVGTAAICQSMGALTLMLLMLLSTQLARRYRLKALLLVLAAFPLVFPFARVTLDWHLENIISFIEGLSPTRAESLDFRVWNEKRIIQNMRAQFWTGRGPILFGVVETPDGRQEAAIVDSYWIILFATSGFFALMSFFGMFTIPTWKFLRRVRGNRLLSAQHASAFAITLVVTMFALDCVINAQINPIYVLALGGLAGYVTEPGFPR